MNEKDKLKTTSDDAPQTGFDMYRFFSRWDVVFLIAFIVAFLIFTMAVFLYPQAV